MALIEIPIGNNIQTGPTDLGAYVSQIVGVFLSIAAIAAFIYLVLAGIQWITAGGDKNKLEEAKNRITGAIIGLVIVAVSWAVFVLIDSFLGIGIAGQTSSSNPPPNSGGGSTAYCVPVSHCCSDVNNSNCFCQNPNYTSASNGTCDLSGTTGVYCSCVPI